MEKACVAALSAGVHGGQQQQRLLLVLLRGARRRGDTQHAAGAERAGWRRVGGARDSREAAGRRTG